MKKSIYAILCAMLMCCAFLFVACGEAEAPAHEHSFEETVTKEPTCTDAGEKTLTCACGLVQKVLVPSGHTDVKVVAAVEATCTEDGTTEGSECVACGTVLTAAQIIPATGHVEASIPDVAADCIYDGSKNGVECSVCHVTIKEPEVIPARGHYNREGGTVCDYCGMTMPEFCTHSQTSTEQKVTTAPTCTEAGASDIIERCTECGQVMSTESSVLPAVGHTAEKIPAIAPTCTSEGFSSGEECTVCGEILIAPERVPMMEHSYGEWKVTTAPSCVNPGQSTSVCNFCDAFRSEPIEPTGHNYVDGVCTGCGERGNKQGTVVELLTPASVLQILGKLDSASSAVDLTSLLSELNLYVNIPSQGTSVSVKDGYVTVKQDAEGNRYLGFNNGYAVYADDEKVIGERPIFPTEQVESAFAEAIKYISAIDALGTYPTVDLGDVYYEEHWYYLTNSCVLRLAKQIARLAYEENSGEALDAETAESLDGIVEETLSSADIKLGFAVDNEVLNGIKLSVNVREYNEIFGFVGTVYAEVKLSETLDRLEYITVELDMNEPEIEEFIKAELGITCEYSEDGSFTALCKLENAQAKLEGTEILALAEINASFTEDYIPTALDAKAQLIELGAKIGSTTVYNYPEGGDSSSYDFDWCATVNALANVSLAVEITADFSEIKAGNATLHAKLSSKTENERLAVGYIYGSGWSYPAVNDMGEALDVTEEEVLAKLTDAEKKTLLDTFSNNFTVEAELSAENNVGKLSLTETYANGTFSGMTLDFEMNSDKTATIPEQIKNLIDTYGETVKVDRSYADVSAKIAETAPFTGGYEEFSDKRIASLNEEKGWSVTAACTYVMVNKETGTKSTVEMMCTTDPETIKGLIKYYEDILDRYPDYLIEQEYGDPVIIELEDGVIFGSRSLVSNLTK